MYLPENILYCIEKLENAGFAAYAVGGCVRDACLGLTPHDYDLCTSALPEQTEEIFQNHRLILAGKKHGTVAVVIKGEVVEITTFRTEGTYADNRHPDWVEFVPNVEEDLARRDFTVNAMAYSPTRGYADPFGGREDLEKGILRAVRDPGERFTEDSLRILRGIRFASRFRLEIEAETEKAMAQLAPLMENLARERVFEELSKMLPTLTAEEVVRYSPILAAVIPELAPLMGFDQCSPHHAYDLMTHVAHVVAQVPEDVTLRWAALLHDVGKVPTFTRDETGRGHFYGHAKESAVMADGILRRLKAPNDLRQRVVLLIEKHMTRPLADKKFLRRQLSAMSWEAFTQLLYLQHADMNSKGIDEPGENYLEIARLLREIKEENACLMLKDLAVNGRDLMALGIKGKALGQTLNALLEQVLDEKLPNEKEALLAFVKDTQGEKI